MRPSLANSRGQNNLSKTGTVLTMAQLGAAAGDGLSRLGVPPSGGKCMDAPALTA
jgi:hypothetical protein